MALKLKHRAHTSLGMPQKSVSLSSLRVLPIMVSTIVFGVMLAVVMPTFAVAQDAAAGSDGPAAVPENSPSADQPNQNDSGERADGNNDGEGQPRMQRRWAPRPPSGPGCPFRERDLELIV